MSAFRLSKWHINALISAGMSNDYAWFCDDSTLTFVHKGIQHRLNTLGAHEIGAALIDLNNRSVNTRYSEDDAPEPYTLERLNVEVLTPVVILRLIACYRYQACEAPGWEDSLAAAYIDALERAAINALPGYDEAPWALEESNYQALLAAASAPGGTAA